MFPSSGIFADINCPFSKRGRCGRPHCCYKHAPEERDECGDSCKSAVVNATGIQNGYLTFVCKDPVTNELERINKEIETVRHEVEEEKRRLSCYQTLQFDNRNTPPVTSVCTKAKTTGKSVDRCSSWTKTSSRAKKYVVDGSKPRTDLEYDPLSNFSAGLRSCGSSGKEQKLKNGRVLKRQRETVTCEQKKPNTQVQVSPDILDDSSDDSVLIIDVPYSPDRKKGRSQKRVDCVAGKSQDADEELKEVDTEPPMLDSSLSSLTRTDACKIIGPGAGRVTKKRVCNCCGVEDRLCLSTPLKKVGFKNKAVECVEDLTGSSERLESECQEITETEAKIYTSSNKRDQNQTNPGSEEEEEKLLPVEFSQHRLDPPSSVEKMNPLQPRNVLLKNSLLHKQHPSSASVNSPATNRAESSEASERLLLKEDNEEIIIISSSDEDYSDVELSDSDPMEECYRIFMEANNEEQPKVSAGAGDVEKPNVSPQTLAGKKRVAHEPAPTEQPMMKTRPQPQVLVPLRGPAASGFCSQSSVTSYVQQVQQRASMMTASLKSGQAFVSSTCQKKPETQTTSSALIQTPANTQLAPGYMNYLPVGTSVIEVGNNLHFILPEGSFPLSATSSSCPVTPVLTPVTQGQMSVKQTYYAAGLTPVPRCRPTAPVLIPAPARKSSLASDSAHSGPSTSTTPQPAAKSQPTRRRLKQQQYEAAKEKVPHDVRQRYVNLFTEEFFKTTANIDDAFEKAVAEEKTVYNRSINRLKYLSVAVNSLKRLKNQSALTSKHESEVNTQRLKGNIPFNTNKIKGKGDSAFYESLKDYILTEEKLIESNYPVQHPEKPGSAALFVDNKKNNTDPLKRICCRCGATYSVSQTGKHTRKEECNYHYGRVVRNKVPGGVESRYSCCEGVMGAPGCQVFKLHVHDSLSLDGFVSTKPRRPSDTSCPGVYSLDCETCYTVNGVELSRVTVVDSSLQVVYDTFVQPDNDVIDYNTRFSGISEDDVRGNDTSIREVQQTLLSFISEDTVLIGHGLETDLCALKLLHGTVVDTSLVFPHRLGPPHKLTLNRLTAEYLRRIIQESVCGHDTAEDAAACMELMWWKVKEDGKLKK